MSVSFTISDGLIIAATIVGPIAAVQAQKWIERSRERDNRREWVFSTLMQTRGTRLSSDHVRALNMITMAFHNPRGRDKKCQGVLAAWREYFDHFATDFRTLNEAQVEVELKNRENLFVALLAAMATERGFEFDPIDIRKGGYHPVAFMTNEATGRSIMEGALEVLGGRTAIRVQLEDAGNSDLPTGVLGDAP